LVQNIQRDRPRSNRRGVSDVQKDERHRALQRAKVAINYKVKEYGEMIKLNLDSNAKTIELELMLEGEKEPLHVKVNRYELREENGRYYLIAEDIVTSRAWINTVAAQYLHGQKFEIPEEYAKLLKVVV
jgi:hypothetical protein